MKAVVLTAGEGARMRPLTYSRPKTMLPLINRPILEHLLLQAREAGIREFVFVIGYHGERIIDHFGDGARWGVRIEYATQEAQLGTADALERARPFLGDKFLVMNGDGIFGAEDMRALLSRDGPGMGIWRVGDTRGLGTVEMEGDKIVRIHEKLEHAPSNLVNAGLYCLNSDIMGMLPRVTRSPRGEYELTDCLQMAIDQGQEIGGQPLHCWLNLSYPWDLLWANEVLMKEMECQRGNVEGTVEDGAVLKGPVWVGKDTVIKAHCYIVGPVAIGQGCDIGPSCYIRPYTAVGDHCHIGSFVEVKNSIILPRSKVPHHNYVGDSVIGEGCNLGAGTKIANLKFDGKPVKIGRLDTGRRKLGAIIGDGVSTGINSCINVGTIIGNNSRIGPGAVAHGQLPPNSRVL